MENTDDEEELFLAAIDIADSVERAKFIRDSCSGNRELEDSVFELLAHHDDNPDFLEQRPVRAVECLTGYQIGPYQIAEVLGEGGCGIVYRAKQQTPIRRDVAFKVLKLGMDTAAVVQRFEQERQTLALLKHPQIAAVIDAGATESGRPYFVMELVEGMPVDEFCDAKRLDIRQRLDIMLQVCGAVQHAHQKGIIHRDLKPTNILVAAENDGSTAPQVKVIDFGIAKVVTSSPSDVTQHGQLLGTPDYMSPEQREQAADVDVRSDVYALGALLCKLLTGLPPEFKYTNQGRRPQQDSLILPSSQVKFFDPKHLQTVALHRRETSKTLPKAFAGELDWMTRKALASDPNDRYASVDSFAADLKAYLKSEPVDAGPPTWSYRARKFVRRNQLASVALVLLMLSILVGTVASTVGFLKANRERKAAIAERDNSRETTKLMQRLLSLGNIQAGHHADFTVRQMLDEFSEILESDSTKTPALQPRVEADVRQTLGKSYWSLGLMDRAGSHLRRALELRNAYLGDEHLEVARCEIDVAKYLASTSQIAEAESAITRALPILLSASPSEELVWAYRVQAIVQRERGAYEETLQSSQQALDIAKSVLGDDHPTTVSMEVELTPIFLLLQDRDQAETHSQEALAHATELGEVSYNAGTANRYRAHVLESLGNLQQATDYIKEALRIDRQVVGETSGSVVLDLITMARLSRKRGRLERAEEAARTACDYAEDVTIEPSLIKANAYDELAQTIHAEEPREALKLWQKAIDAKTETRAISPILGRYLNGQGNCHKLLGEFTQAEEKFRQCVALLKEISSEDIRRDRARLRIRESASEMETYFPLHATLNLMALLYEQGRVDELNQLDLEVVHRAREVGSDRCETLADLIDAIVLLANGKVVDAEELLDGIIEKGFGPHIQRIVYARVQLLKADVLIRHGEFHLAQAHLERLQGFVRRRKFAMLKLPLERLWEAIPSSSGE